MRRTILPPILALLAVAAMATRPALTQGTLRTQDSTEAGDSSRTPKKKPAPSLDSVIVFVTKTGAKYHRMECQYLKSSAIPILLIDARRRYDPCSRCNPPE